MLCSKCSNELPESHNKKQYGKTCKSCWNEISKQWRRKTKQEVIDHYGGKCACCGESTIEFLAIDHICGNGNEHRKSIKHGGKHMYQWLKKNKYPEGFRVLCHNCNMALGLYGYCPHNNLKPNAVATADYS